MTTFNRGFYGLRILTVCNEKGEETKVKVDAADLSLAEFRALEKVKLEGKIKGKLSIRRPIKGAKNERRK